MKPSKVALCIAVFIVVTFVLVDRSRTNKRIDAIVAAQNQIPPATQLSAAPETTVLNDTLLQSEQTRVALATATTQLTHLTDKVADLERKMDALRNDRLLSNGGLLTSFDPPTSTQRRSWGPEQVVGPPDTHRAGDIPTAWASRQPDAGEEWLKLDYESAVDLAEVRVRETYNPGAISKVSAFLAGGREVVIWEGQEPPGEAPVETVFKVPGKVRAQSVKVYLDTTRVPGWNEIDAVELVAKDGTRQWASQAAASSTYAEQTSGLQESVRRYAQPNELQLR